MLYITQYLRAVTFVVAGLNSFTLAGPLADKADLPKNYPTTSTSVWSTTSTTTTPYDPNLPVNYYSKSVITTLTVTVLEPWAASPTAFPYTMSQTAISHATIETRLLTNLDGPWATAIETRTPATATSTWVLWPTTPSDLAPAAALPCAQCAAVAALAAPDPRCARLGLATACQGRQCASRGGLWWCYRRHYSDDAASLVMGRACWGNKTEYAQLAAPCVAHDYAVACTPCQGRDVGWGAVHWHSDV